MKPPQAWSRQRGQELDAQLAAQAQARYVSAQTQWKQESEEKLRAATEALRILLARTEKERDEARGSSAEAASQLQNLEKRLTEASLFLNPRRSGNGDGNGRANVKGHDTQLFTAV